MHRHALIIGIVLLLLYSHESLASLAYHPGFNVSDQVYKEQFRRTLSDAKCDSRVKSSTAYTAYFTAMDNIYSHPNSDMHISRMNPSSNLAADTCLAHHKDCGWFPAPRNNLPQFVLSVGLEGAGHHLWTEILDSPIFDCVWINARHYKRNVGDGVPRTTTADLKTGFQEMLKFRTDKGMPPCKTIYDAEDSFPTGAIRKQGRLFMRPDIVNLQKLDGVLFNIKYLLIIRNVTDTAMSALRRNFVTNVDAELRAVEHTLTYIESALKRVPCHKVFIAHYEHAIAEPSAYVEPLSAFLELNAQQKSQLEARLKKSSGKPVTRKVHKLTHYPDCKAAGLSDTTQCYNALQNLLDAFFLERGFMWPSFAGNGFDFNTKN